MTTLTDEEAFALGVRAIRAGMTYRIGTAILFWWKAPGGFALPRRRGVIVDIGKGENDIRVDDGSERVRCLWGHGNVPDLRDPGTKGHAIAQLRERTKGAELSARCDVGKDEFGKRWTNWYVGSDEHGGLLTDAPEPCTTEEEAIVAAFEATKETP